MDTVPPSAFKSNTSSPEASGIYKITCIANEKFYIGSAVNLRKRQSNHLGDLRKNQHHSPTFQRAFNKYGEDAFTFEVLEFVLVPFLIEREQYWLDKLQPFDKKGFNINRDARSRLGRKHTPESRAKMGLANFGNKYNLGRKRTPETLERLKQSHLGKVSNRKDKKTSLETREKLRQANLGKTRPPRGNTYRIEGEAAYISLTQNKETVIDVVDLERVLSVTWYAAYNSSRKIYYARSEHQTLLLARYIMDAKEGEHVEHINHNPLDNRRSNLHLVTAQKPNSKTGIHGVTVHKPSRNPDKPLYQFRCNRVTCKAVKYFPYTNDGLEAARAFSDNHYATMKETK